MKRAFPTLLLACFGALTSIAPLCAIAQAYPTKPINLVVPFPAGGITDNGARLFARMLGERLGQPVTVDNQGGASGTIAAQFVRRARPDGYTILYGTSGPMVAVHSLMKSVPYDTLKDFTPVYGLAETPMVLVTPADSPFKTLPELVEYARKNPGKLTFGSPGLGTAPHLAGEMLKTAAKIDMLHVPYKGMAPAMSDLLGGRIRLMFDYAATIAPHVASGAIRPVALSTATRLASHPNIPTPSEGGFPQVNIAPWTGIFLPAGTPNDVVEKLTVAIESTVKDPVMVDYYQKGGQVSLNLRRDKFVPFIEAEIPKWKSLIERSGVERQ